jgi:hypothetical protein
MHWKAKYFLDLEVKQMATRCPKGVGHCRWSNGLHKFLIILMAESTGSQSDEIIANFNPKDISVLPVRLSGM